MADRSYSLTESLDKAAALFVRILDTYKAIEPFTRRIEIIESETNSVIWVSEKLSWPDGARGAFETASRNFQSLAAKLDGEWKLLAPAMRAVIGRLEHDGRWEAPKIQEMYRAMEQAISDVPGFAAMLNDMAKGNIDANARAESSLDSRLSRFPQDRHARIFLSAWGFRRGASSDEGVRDKLERMDLAAAADAEANAGAVAGAATSALAVAERASPIELERRGNALLKKDALTIRDLSKALSIPRSTAGRLECWKDRPTKNQGGRKSRMRLMEPEKLETVGVTVKSAKQKADELDRLLDEQAADDKSRHVS